MTDLTQRPTVSSWHAVGAIPERPPLRESISTETCIIGAGIAGLAVAYELARAGGRVVVLDHGLIGGGETGRTTSHLASAMDDRFYHLEQVHGRDGARICYESHATAIDWIESVAQREHIDCQFERLDGYLFLPPGGDERELQKELEAAQRAGFVDAQRIERAPLSQFDTGPCLRFPRQGQVQPLSLLAGLATAVERAGGVIHCHTHATEVRTAANDKHKRTVHCEGGPIVTANQVVVATNSPINTRVAIHTKQHPYRTYVIALRVPRGAVPLGLYWDTSQDPKDPEGPYHYVRLQDHPDAGEDELLIVGGEDHKTGQADDAEQRWNALERWTRERFPVRPGIVHRWSGQVLEPVDYVGFIGLTPGGEDRVYLATGDSGQGITHGAIAGMLIADLVLGRKNAWAELYDPSRKRLSSAGTFAGENLNAVWQYTDWLAPGDAASVADIAPGQGAVIRSGLKLIACFKDTDGSVRARSAACPHMGAAVRWNPAECTWDCPAHGSRFAASGEVVNGPAPVGLSDARPPT